MVLRQQGMIIAWIFLILCFAVACPVHAEDANYVKKGIYLGALFVNNGMSGDFDDSTFLISDLKLYDVPDVDDGQGFGIVLGGRSDRGAWEIGYQRSNHDTRSLLLGESEAYYNVIDVNYKFDVLAKDRLRPYVLIGAGIPWLTIKDGALNGFSFEDETFIGFDLNLGVGAAYYLHPQWAVMGGVICRWNWFTIVDDHKIDDSLFETALGITLGVAYTF